MKEREPAGIMAISEARKKTQDLAFTYTNWLGETRQRRVQVLGMRHGTSDYHKEPGFLLVALDLESGMIREFSVAGMRPEEPNPQAEAPA